MTRSAKKAPYIAYHLLEKLKKISKSEKKIVIQTWSRASTIIPSMIGYTIHVHNGQKHVPVFISDLLIGHKLGEFVNTRTFRSHKKSDKKIKRK